MANTMNKIKIYKYIMCLVLCLGLCMALGACGGESSSDGGDGSVPVGIHQANQGDVYGVKTEAEEILSGKDIGDLYVTVIRETSTERYPDITIGDAFDSYFGSPEWRAFEGTREGDDGSYDVVEFTGTCEYDGAESEALIQFTIAPDFSEFETTYFSINSESMTFRDLNALMEIAFYQLSEEKE